MQYASPNLNSKVFLNPIPTEVSSKGAFGKIIREALKKHPGRFPTQELGPFPVDLTLLHQKPTEALRLTWLGHSTTIIELEEHRFLTDPVWYKRASPFAAIGPKRFLDVPIALSDLPPIDFILLSHDHYDHLDKDTIIYLTRKKIPVLCLLGVGTRLIKWGINKSLITEMDWWQTTCINNRLSVTACPARHFSGRNLTDRFTTLWGSFALKGRNESVYFGADSGLFPGFKTIGDQLGPFDVTLLDVGAYNEQWASIHMGPENAIKAHLDLKGKLVFPIHWGTFALAFHPWKEPIERLQQEAAIKNVPLLVPAPGQTVLAKNGPYNSKWWEKFT